jgi:hypothetical protein
MRRFLFFLLGPIIITKFRPKFSIFVMVIMAIHFFNKLDFSLGYINPLLDLLVRLIIAIFISYLLFAIGLFFMDRLVKDQRNKE